METSVILFFCNFIKYSTVLYNTVVVIIYENSVIKPYNNEEVLYLQPMIPPKRFDVSPLTGGCSEGLAAFRFFFEYSRS